MRATLRVFLLFMMILMWSESSYATHCVFVGANWRDGKFACGDDRSAKIPDPISAPAEPAERRKTSLTVPHERIEHQPYGRIDQPNGVRLAAPAIARDAARRHGVDPLLVHAVITTESAWNPVAVSHKGARGLMQLMPETSRRFGVLDPFEPQQNIEGGVRYLAWLQRHFSNTQHVIAAYNAGEEAVWKYGGVPPYPETQAYVRKVIALCRSC